MSVTLAAILDAYMDQMALAPAAKGLGIPHQLGRPIFGQTRPTLPIGAVIFQQEGYRTQPAPMPRLGQVPPTGYEMNASHFLYASSEPELVMLLDRMRTVRATVASVICDNVIITVRFSPTRRAENPSEERMLDFVAVTDVTFTWS